MSIEQALKDGWIFLYLADAPTKGQFRAFHGATNVYAKSVDELLSIIGKVKRFV